MINEPYLWLKALHIIAVITWMAGLLYLPRLFVYHCQVPHGSDASEKFKIMERKLLRAIINPSMIAVFIFGITLAFYTETYREIWFQIKFVLVIILSAIHGLMAKYRKDFANDKNTRSERFYRIFNEIPAILMVMIVFIAVLKP